MKLLFVVWLAATALLYMLQAEAGIVDISAISPEVAVLSGNKNRGNGITRNQVGGNQETQMRLETTETGNVGKKGGGGGGGLLGGLL